MFAFELHCTCLCIYFYMCVCISFTTHVFRNIYQRTAVPLFFILQLCLYYFFFIFFMICVLCPNKLQSHVDVEIKNWYAIKNIGCELNTEGTYETKLCAMKIK